MKDRKKQVEPRSMTNDLARECYAGVKTLASLLYSAELGEDSLTPDVTRDKNARLGRKWHELLDSYMPMMVQIRKHEDFTDQDIDNTHVMMARFMALYVDLLDGGSITNYIHLIGAGHVRLTT